MENGLLLILLFFMIVGSLIAVETRSLLSAIISIGAIGFLLSIAFLLLGAPDIAITQVVVEILCLIILIRATINRDLTTISGDREFFSTVITITMVIIITVISVHIFSDFPQFGKSVIDRFTDAPSQTYVALGLEKTGAANIVTAILLDFRAYDTLGEATVLFCAILGALALLRKNARKAVDKKEQTDE